jgi:hypothetical protein
MKRFNLLLVTQEQGLREIALKSLSRVYKSNFVFEVASLQEAHGMLAKLHIDILVVDLDREAVNMVKLSDRLPHLQVVGLSANPSRVQVQFDPVRHQILEKRDFSAALTAELKGMRKGSPAATPEPITRRVHQPPAQGADFRDFFKLAEAVASRHTPIDSAPPAQFA